MTRKCFFVPEGAPDTEIFDLPPLLSRQLDRVLRARAGESIELLDGRGSAWVCLITGIRRGTVSVRLIGKLERPAHESPLQITLGLAMARSETMDLVIRQATELGVLRLSVFRALRSQYGLSGKQSEKKKERWSRIAGEAICQCGRARALEIEIFEDLDRFLASFEVEDWAAEDSLKIFALEREAPNSIRDLRGEPGPDIHRILAVVGPEGGWDSVESLALTGAGFKPVSLGPRTLRLETAAVALVSSIQLLWGDMGEMHGGS
ncbi:MAG: RsmE family RNA methyltransferase [Syntrophobacteraceae bacterium]|jgi:16S rRNA (uracil1498-N3)-methyltransferase